MEQMKMLQDDQQMRMMLEISSGGSSMMRSPVMSQMPQIDFGSAQYAHRASLVPDNPDIDDFIARWDLNQKVSEWMYALPETVQEEIIMGFDGNSSQDGNLWGRLLNFAVSKWGQAIGLDNGSVMLVKGLPEDAQLLVVT